MAGKGLVLKCQKEDSLASAENKLAAAAELICIEHPNQKVMVFSETLESPSGIKALS